MNDSEFETQFEELLKSFGYKITAEGLYNFGGEKPKYAGRQLGIKKLYEQHKNR